ncbi:flavodoxin family protein [Ideonella livida]|uniref:NAD(P)H-dependent oxidoreductase n=1 Tax=Ideonella livida TaxID=2707176 RepID=A0A7C9TM12_9BURK|nr:NAD(P)H-dependent oxidoreductase [Ideonella livida]NDY92385.1 NAD(P)H-dependent oxidoreductase [Ideonella livida]
MSSTRHVLFLVSNSREPGQLGNTETLARRAAAALPEGSVQTWLHLSQLDIPPFVDVRHTQGHYAAPEGDLKRVLDALLAATDVVAVAPVYWFSLPAPLKGVLDHWSGFLRVPGLDFKARMSGKRLWAVSTNGSRAKAQPMFDSLAMCAEFMGMRWMPPLWGQGGAPGAVLADTTALQAADDWLLG